MDPRTAPEVLAGIAQARPELRVFVAMNPSAYPGLVQWLALLGDPAVDAALAARPPVPAGPPTAPLPQAPPVSSRSLPREVTPVTAGHQRRRGALIAVVLVGVLVLLGGGVAAYRLLRGDTRGPAPREIRTQLTLTPVVTGSEQITTETIARSIGIIRERLDSSGVSLVQISSQDGSTVVVVLRGKPDKATLDLVRKRGVMRFRAVLVEGSAAPIPLPAPTVTSAPGATPTAATSAVEPKDASDYAWITPAIEKAFIALDCANPKSGEPIVDDPTKPMVTCSADGQAKYILGPAEVLGSEIKNATSGQQQTSSSSTGEYEVRLDFNPAGTKSFCDVTSRIVSLPSPRNQFGIVLDNQVISAPVAQASLCSGNVSITGSFTAASAKVLGKQLNFGALPLTFQVTSQDQITAQDSK